MFKVEFTKSTKNKGNFKRCIEDLQDWEVIKAIQMYLEEEYNADIKNIILYKQV